MRSAFLFCFCCFVLTGFSQSYKLDEGYKISFTNPDVSGTFDQLSAPSIVFDEAKLSSSKLILKLEVSSINTGNGLMNKHAKGADWFNAEKYPSIEFTSSKIEKTNEGYKATGKLQMHGISKEVSIPFTFTEKGSKGTFIAKFRK